MEAWGLAPTAARPQGYEIDGCTRCGGVWLGTPTLNAMIDEARQIGAHVDLDEVQVRRRVVAERAGPVTYRRCPACDTMMARRNFARVSGIILDSCVDHGTFFDAGELEDVLDFVRTGGLLLSQKKKAQEEARQNRADAANRAPAGTAGGAPYGGIQAYNFYEHPHGGGSILTTDLVSVGLAVIRWGAGWTARVVRGVVASRRSK